MDMKLKENKKFDVSKYKTKVIKVFKVLLIVFITLLTFHFATNFKEYRRICIDNDVPVDNYIITNQDLEELSNKYLESNESSNFVSPLDSEKGELKRSINEIKEKIESKLASIQKKSLTEEEQKKLDGLVLDYNNVLYDEGDEYKLTKLNDIKTNYSDILTEVTNLDTQIQVRELKQDISKVIKKIDKLIEQISGKDLTSEETSTYKSIKQDYGVLDKNVANLSLNELKLLKTNLNDTYDRLSKLDKTISKRISSEKEALVQQQAGEQAQINLTQQEAGAQEQTTLTNSNTNSNTEDDNEAASKETPVVEEAIEEDTQDMCYQTYEEAQQVGMQTMLNDPSIQKMEVDSSNNCIKYYR